METARPLTPVRTGASARGIEVPNPAGTCPASAAPWLTRQDQHQPAVGNQHAAAAASHDNADRQHARIHVSTRACLRLSRIG